MTSHQRILNLRFQSRPVKMWPDCLSHWDMHIEHFYENNSTTLVISLPYPIRIAVPDPPDSGTPGLKRYPIPYCTVGRCSLSQQGWGTNFNYNLGHMNFFAELCIADAFVLLYIFSDIFQSK